MYLQIRRNFGLFLVTELLQLRYIPGTFGVNGAVKVTSQHLYWTECWALTGPLQRVDFLWSHSPVDLLWCSGSLSSCFTQLLLSCSWSTASLTLHCKIPSQAWEYNFTSKMQDCKNAVILNYNCFSSCSPKQSNDAIAIIPPIWWP